MKLQKHTVLFPLLGIVTAVLRGLLYRFGTDEKGLLVSFHPFSLACWLSIAAAFALALTLRVQKGSNRYEDNFSASPAAAVGCWALAVGLMLSTDLRVRLVVEALVPVRRVLVWLACAAAAALGGFRLRGRKPVFGCNLLICVFLAVHMLLCYQDWCSNPQLQDYLFSLLGGVGMMLFAYYQTAFEAGMGSRRIQRALGLLGCCFCLAAVPRSGYPVLYLGGAAWMLTNLCHAEPIQEEPAA